MEPSMVDLYSEQCWSLHTFRKETSTTRPTHKSVQTIAEFQHFPCFHCLQSWFFFSYVSWRHSVPDTCRLAWQEKQVEIVTWRHASRSGVHLQVTDLSRAKRLQLVHYLKCWESGSSWGVALVHAGETGNTYIWFLNLPQELNFVFVVYLMKLSVSKRYMVYGRWMGLKIRPENDEAESGLSQNGGTTSALTRQYGETAEIRLATRGTNVSYFNLECEWAHVGYTKIGLRGRLLKTYSGLKWIRHDIRASFCYCSDEILAAG